MKKFKYRAIIKAAHRINHLYSVLWIAATRSDKWAYRDNSKIHAALVRAEFDAAMKLEQARIVERMEVLA